jgi:TusA-related sulfurtransferase
MTSPENAQEIPNFSGFTCTTLMIRLKMLLKKAPPGSAVEIIVRRDQTDMIEIPFSRTGYDVKILKLDNNLFHVRLQKRDPGAGS